MRAVANESKIPVGTLLVGKYRVTREIGRGGMAAVYEAEHTSLGKKVAVKVLASELSASHIVIERFFREARAAASVKSPYIVDIYDSGRLEDGRPFICMEMLEGESLYDRMARVRLIDPATTVRIIVQCAKGLLKAHAAGIVHRDLKPENIFLTRSEDGEDIAKILDFGLAKFYSPVEEDAATARLTREGAVFGTPAYMSPEQVKGQGSVDQRADLWALGCMAYECLIGRPVWNVEQGVAMTFAAIATAEIPTPSRERGMLPPSFDAWFKKALARNREDRFQNAKELADALVASFDLNAPGAQGVGSFSGPSPALVLQVASSSADLTPLVPNVGGSLVPADSVDLLPGRSSDRQVAPSATDLPPTARSSLTGGVGAKTSPLRIIASSVALLGAGVAAALVWANVLRPQLFTPIVFGTTVAPIPTGSTAPTGDSFTPGPESKWMVPFGEGQKLFSQGNLGDAVRKIKDAQDAGGPASILKAFAEELKGAATPGGPCHLKALAHPRFGVAASAGRPTVAVRSAGGSIVAWTDDHERAGHDKIYGVAIDDAGRPLSDFRDLSPEGDDVVRPILTESGDRTALLYWDKGGNHIGIHVRWLDAEGRISGPLVLVGAARPGTYYPSMTEVPDGFMVVWQDDRDGKGDDLFLRKLGPDLTPTGAEIRVTDYASVAGRAPSARYPSAVVASNALFIAYKLEREPQHQVFRMRIPLDSPDLAKGLDDPGAAVKKGDRELGDVAIVSDDKTKADAPQIACGKEGCFVTWHGETGSCFGAMLDPAKGTVIWKKPLGAKGAHPGLGVSKDGIVGVAFYEGGKVKFASLSREGVGPLSTVVKLAVDPTRLGPVSRPSVAPAHDKGEFLLGWQDQEAAHTEVFSGTVACTR